MREWQIPVTLSPLWETVGSKLTKIDVITFYTASCLEKWTFWLLVTLCSIPRDLQHNCKVKCNVKIVDESLIATCEHHITKRLLSHGGMWTQHNPRVSLGIIYYDIKRILLTNLQYYQKFWIQVFSLYLDSLTVLVLLNCY